MNFTPSIIAMVLLIAVSYAQEKNSKSNDSPDELRSGLEIINTRIEDLYRRKDVDELIGLYADELTYFPEYKPGIFYPDDLRKFYTGWFSMADIQSYRKKIYEVLPVVDYILESGTFVFTYTSASNSAGQYKGNYMILWKKDSQGKLLIVSEAFGADHYIERGHVPYAGVSVERSSFIAKHTVTTKLLSEIEEFNAIVIDAVATGNAEARANGFTQDAISMAPFSKLEVGMEEIAEHMRKTYNPGISFKVKHNYFRVYDLGKYVFINGHYKGEWGDATNGGSFEGNMSNLMKRNESGKLLMFRQLGNRE